MFEMGWFSVKLFLKGKLIRNPVYFIRQTTIGTLIGLLLLVSIAQVNVPLWLPIIVSSLLTGAIMPFLLKDFKMK
ncbi:hypothetical protein NIES4075_47910 [Tolypothrix sp. NIES-4075]|uniref:hypothetical protein n=1 Tax=Tolypothrix sp. NIES-4075 TaxID=2005459 RepID=UPI000B5C94B3|nr:hypothetical protein [Tolypothrix sp. NIES-4075]GAX43776.1 hypothetical protein NIES4075_47910 [Tolypothrix sp. NIES-4075]